MSGQKLIRVFNAGALLLILLSAYAGKSLHTHPDEYYRYLTESDANTTSSALADDCAICHFHFFSYTHSTDWVLDSEFRLLETLFPPGKLHPFNHRSTGYATPRTACNRVNKSVPGPPASGSIRPHAPTGAAKQSFSQGILSHRPHCCGRSPCPAKTVLFIHNYAIICFSVPFKEA